MLACLDSCGRVVVSDNFLSGVIGWGPIRGLVGLIGWSADKYQKRTRRARFSGIGTIFVNFGRGPGTSLVGPPTIVPRNRPLALDSTPGWPYLTQRKGGFRSAYKY